MAEENNLCGKATLLPDDLEQGPTRVLIYPSRERKKYSQKWLILWQEQSEIGVSVVEQAKMERPLTQTEYRVRDYLLGTIGLGNYVYVNQAEVARELRLARSNVSVAIKRLIELQIVLQGPKVGRSNTYMLNPAYCYFGRIENGVKARNKAIQTGKAKVINFNKHNKDNLNDAE